MQHLLIIEDDDGRHSVLLSDTTNSIGRDKSNSIRINSHDVSRQHALLLRVPHSEDQDCLYQIVDGNLQGKPSTNGLFINGKRCHGSHVLHPGDSVVFGGAAKARYYTADDAKDINALLLGTPDDDILATLISDEVASQNNDVALEKRHNIALTRLASFPELFSHPIIELSLEGELTYLNPAAVQQFSDIQSHKLQHPLLQGIIDQVKTHHNKRFIREITVADRMFEQSIHYIPESDLIRSYLVDITERKQAVAALQEREQRFRAIFNQTFQFSGLLDASGMILEVNQTALDFAGLTREAVLNIPLEKSPWWSTLPDVKKQLQTALASAASGQFVRYETKILGENGQVKHLDFSLKPTRDTDNQLRFIIFEGQDVSGHKQIEADLKALHDDLESQVKARTLELTEATERLRQEEQALLASYATNRALLNAIPDPMFRISREGKFVNFKEPKQYTLPFDVQKCLHRSLDEVLPLTVAQALQQSINVALATEEVQVTEFTLQTDTDCLEYEARIAISDQDETMMIVREITERKRSETEIRHALERARELNELKTRFVSMTSHEFRTPLTTILSSAELIEHYSDSWSPDKQLKYLHKIQTAAKHMTELLNDVLLINKAEAGKMAFNPQPLDLSQFCAEIIEALQITTTQHSLTLVNQTDIEIVMIDRKLMRHILTNLISNAINYSPKGGDIVVTLSNHKGELQMTVKDSGIGIPAESLPTLFDSFVRGSNVGNISGTGLGLAIVKRSVDVHRGKIICESVVGAGTQFIITLPEAVLPDSQAVSPQSEEALMVG